MWIYKNIFAILLHFLNLAEMAKKQTITFVFHLVMLLIFTFSIFPRKYLHDAFSHHTDSFHIYEQNKGTTVEQKSFQCDQFAMVADNTFLGFLPLLFEEIYFPVKEEVTSFYRNIIHSIHPTTSLRGPPSLA